MHSNLLGMGNSGIVAKTTFVIFLFSVLLVASFAIFPIQEVEAAPGDFTVTESSGTLLSVTPGGSVSVIASGLGAPTGVAIDSGGDFIVTDQQAGRLLRVTPGGSVSVITSLLVGPFGVAIDSGGDFIVTDSAGRLLRVTPGGSISVIASGLVGPFGVAIDSGGDFIVTDSTGRLLRVTPGGSVSVIASSGLGLPGGVAIDSGGDFIVTDFAGRLLRVTPGGSVSVIASSGLGLPVGVAIDSGGDFIVTDFSAGRLLRVTPGGSVSVIASVFGSPFQVAIEPLFTATQNGNWNVGSTWVGGVAPITISSIDTVIIPSGITVTIPSGVTITNSGTIFNFGTINVNFGSSIANIGTINNSGTINSSGFITNSGTIANDCTGVIIGTITGNQPVDACDPIITAPADIIVEGNVLGGVAFNDAAVIAFLAGASATDNVDGVTAVTNDALTSGVYGVTVHIITFSSTDSSGNTGTATAKITVIDTFPPVLTIPPDTSIEADASPTSISSKDPSVTGVAIATDIVDPSPTISFSDSSSFPTPNPATKIVEVITRTWTATDASGNSSSANQIITVLDTTAPTITISDTFFGACAIPVPVNLITFGSTASDLVDPNPSFTNDAPTEFPIGETPVLHTATDASGNVATDTELVIIGANDPDGDGITECVDTLTTQFSDDADDAPEGGQTEGTIDTRGDQDLLIFDVIDPDGILAFAENTGGSAPAKIIVCDAKGEFELDAGESAIATCTSVKIEILTGQVFVQFNTGKIPGTSTLGPTNILVYDDEKLTITNLSTTDAVMKFKNKTLIIPPGETANIRLFAFPQSQGTHEPPTIGMNLAGDNLIVTCGVSFDGKCFTITALFHEEFKLYEMMSGTHTISITMYCASGVNTCNYAAIGIMPYSESIDNTTWKIELYKDFEGNLTTVTTDPEGFLGTVTVTTQIINDQFWIVSFTVEFKNKDTGPMMFGVQARDNYNAVRNWYLNEGVEFIDSDAYPSIETAFEDSLEINSLCLNEDPTYRYSCAFAENRERATQLAEETLRQMLNGEYTYK